MHQMWPSMKDVRGGKMVRTYFGPRPTLVKYAENQRTEFNAGPRGGIGWDLWLKVLGGRGRLRKEI